MVVADDGGGGERIGDNVVIWFFFLLLVSQFAGHTFFWRAKYKPRDILIIYLIVKNSASPIKHFLNTPP